MVVLSVIIVLLFFEPTVINGRAYNCYSSIPCPLTYPASDPAWSYDVTAQNMPPINLFISTSAATDASKSEEQSQTTQPPPPAPVAEPIPPEKKKKKKKEKSDDRDDWFSAKFFTSLFAIPGAMADTLLNGEIII